MPFTKSLAKKIAEFQWPSRAPYTMADALDLLRQWPLPRERYFARAPASIAEIAEVEVLLDLPLPPPLRMLLETHDGIDEEWTGSGPMIAGTQFLLPLRKRWKSERAQLSPEDIEERRQDKAWMVTSNLLCVGKNQSGDLYFLHLGKVSKGGEHPIVIFDHAEATLHYHQPSLGALVGYVVCEARTHPQKQEAKLAKLFPWTWDADVRKVRRA